MSHISEILLSLMRSLNVATDDDLHINKQVHLHRSSALTKNIFVIVFLATIRLCEVVFSFGYVYS